MTLILSRISDSPARFFAGILLIEKNLKEVPVRLIHRTRGPLRQDEGLLAREWNRDAIEQELVGVRDGFFIVDVARLRHEIDDDLIGDSYDRVLGDVARVDLRRGVIRENGKCGFDLVDVLRGGTDEKIDVLRRAPGAVSDHGEAAD